MSETERPRRRPKWRLLLALVAIVGVSSWGALQAPFVHAKVREKVAQAVRSELGLEASLGSLEFRLPFRIAAHSVRLTHARHGLLVASNELLIVPSFWALLRGELQLKRIIVEGARLRLRVIDGEIVNLPKLPQRPEREDDEPVRIPLRELVVLQASVEVEAKPAYRASLTGVNVIARIVDGERVNLQVSAGQGELTHKQGREQLARAQLALRYRPGRLEVDRLHVDSSVANLTVSGASLDLPAQSGKYRAKVQSDLDLGRFATLPHGLTLPAMAGSVGYTGTVAGQGKRWRVQGDVRGENPALDGFGFGKLALKVDGNEREVKLLAGSHAEIIDKGGLVQLTGKLGLSKELPLDVKVDVRHLVFQKLMAQLGTTQDCIVDWHLRGGFRLKGTANPVAITGPIWADHLSFRALTGPYHDPASSEVIGTPPGRVSGRVVIRPDALRFENLHGKLPHSEMLVTVHVGFDDKLGVSAKSSKLDLRDATSLMGKPIAGHGAFTLDVGGTYSDTTLTGTLDLSDFVLWGNALGHLKTRAVLEKDGAAVRFVDAEVRKNDSHYFVDDLFLDFSEEFVLEGKARFERLAFSDFYDSVDVAGDPDFAPYAGVATGTASARYTLGFRGDGPEGTLVVEADLALDSVEAYGVAFESGSLEGTYHWLRPEQGARGVRLDLRELHLRRGRGALWARGSIQPGGVLQLTLLGEALRTRDIALLQEQGIALEGELNFSGIARGTFYVPELALDVDLVGMQLGNKLLGDGHGKVYVTHRADPFVQRALTSAGELPAEPCPVSRRALARATWGAEPQADGTRLPPRALLVCGPLLRDRVDVDLALGFDRGSSLRGTVALNELPTSWLLPESVAHSPALAGSISAHAAIEEGELQRPDSLVGGLTITRLALGKGQPWFSNAGPVKVALTGNGARIEEARFVGQGTQLSIRGGASFAEGLAASLEGSLDVSVLSTMVPEVVRASGLLAMNVKLTGVFRKPAIFGRAELTGASLLTTLYPEPVEELAASVSFSEREIILEELSAQFGSGQVRMHGSAALRGRALGRYELALDARDVQVTPSEGIELTLGAETTLVGGEVGRLPELSGTVHLQRARYTRPFSLGIADRLTGFSRAKRAEGEAYDPAKDRLALNLRVVDDARIRVNNNLLNGELSIEDSEGPFRLVGTDQRLGMLGTLAFQRGTLRFRSSEFRVEDGTVSFVDEHRIRPQIDVRARTEFRRTADVSGARWSILLHAHGDVDDLRLDTSSEPALASEDIALLLTMGITRAEAERLQTGSLTQGAALEALATVAGVDREVKKALPVIDDFAVTSAYSVRTNRTEPQVVVGKRISERIRASATTGLTTDSNFKTNVQWRLNDQTSVEAGYDNVQTTTASQFGNVGVDLRWRLEFD